MERLTKKGASNYIVNCRPECIEKLVNIEDFEESMGIELSIVIQANMNGIYGERPGYHFIDYYDNIQIDFSNKSMKYWDEVDYPYGLDYFFEDYGKTWALTKEELEYE